MKNSTPHYFTIRLISLGLGLTLFALQVLGEAFAHASNVKGVYMTAEIANDHGPAATQIRNHILNLLDTTELNGIVIDVKETEGAQITPRLQPLLVELKAKDYWTIARIATFRDNSQVEAHPEYYLQDEAGGVWRDNKGNAWLDPLNPGARDYIITFAKNVMGLGFDELQFDYIRFPSDGPTSRIVYYSDYQKFPSRHDVLRDYVAFLDKTLKAYQTDVIISADLFGYAAIGHNDLGIGQRIEDLGPYFDYISPMLYPSHYYSGLYLPADPARQLPLINIPYFANENDEQHVVSAQPYTVVLRSLYAASDILTATPNSRAKLRPWLQDFNLPHDKTRGIYYNAEQVRAQIDAAEQAGSNGWLLWNAANVYTAGALKAK